MQTKTFGEYLVEKRVLSEDHLVDILVEQIQGSPSSLEVVNKNKLVSSRHIIEIIKHQKMTHSGFTEAAKALGFWTKQIEDELDKYASQNRLPLSLILIQRGMTTLDQLVASYDEFISKVEEVEKLNTAQLCPQPLQSEVSTFKFVDLLTEDFKNLFEQFIMKVQSDSTSLEDALKIKAQIEAIKKSLKEDPENTLLDLILEFERVIENWMNKGLAKMQENMLLTFKLVLEGVSSLIWQAKSYMDSGKSQKDLMSDERYKKQYETLLSTAQVLNFDIDTNLMAKK
jgi:hypothetical protein